MELNSGPHIRSMFSTTQSQPLPLQHTAFSTHDRHVAEMGSVYQRNHRVCPWYMTGQAGMLLIGCPGPIYLYSVTHK